MAVTLRDIAQECGLAVSTVSNILNNNATSFASAESRLKVRETAARLGYKKDYLSSSLRTRTTKSIGLVLDQIDEVTRQSFLVPFVEAFSSQGYEVALAEHRHDVNRAVNALATFGDRVKDGVVVFTDLLGRPDAEQARLSLAVQGSKLRILGIGSRMKGLVPSLDIDRGLAIDKTIEGFQARGRRSILVVYEYDWDMRPVFHHWDDPTVTFWSGIHSFEDFEARAVGADWSTFDAVFFRTDRIAMPAVGWLVHRGLRVPDDLEVVGFDNYPFGQLLAPSLSTWDIGFHRLGLRAQQILENWLGGTVPTGDYFELFEPTFVGRKSHRGASI